MSYKAPEPLDYYLQQEQRDERKIAQAQNAFNERVEQLSKLGATNPSDPKTIFKSGAESSGTTLPFDAISPSQPISTARRIQRGLVKGYPRDNWKRGLGEVEYIRERVCHGFEHFLRLMDGSKDGDDNIQGNIDAINWCGMFMAEAYRSHPDVFRAAFDAEYEKKGFNAAAQGQIKSNNNKV